MITKEIFIKYLTSFQHFELAINRIEKALSKGCNLMESDWYEDVMDMLDSFLLSYFTEKAKELVFWYLYESVPKVIYIEHPADIFNEKRKEEVYLYSLEDLYNFLINNPKVYLNNA